MSDDRRKISQLERGAPATAVDLRLLRARLEAARGPEYWRSLEELAVAPEFQELLEREFAPEAAEWAEGLSRRRFLQLTSASLALAGLTACTRQPLEKIVPYVKQPEEIVPGKPLYFATAMTLGGYATGLLVESHLGRPTKIEGNPEHPASLGATCALAQASILNLYDPDRSQVPTHLGRIATWGGFVREIQGVASAQAASGGAGLRLLTGTVTSPTLGRQLRALQEKYPNLQWHQWEAVHRDNVRLAARRAFGEWTETRYEVDRADVILALESDFLTAGPGCLRYAHDFTRRRKVRRGAADMNRLYAVESSPTPTGSVADHRLALSTGEIAVFVLALAAAVGVPGIDTVPGFDDPRLRRWLSAVAADLRSHRGTGLVVAGDALPVAVHVLVHAINETLANTGATVHHTGPVEVEPTHQQASLAQLAADMREGNVDTLLILGVNPVYDAPADLGFAEALSQVRLRIHLGLYADETAEYCHWHVPQAHYLESWTDARAFDGTVTVVQPLIEPLWGGRTAHELLDQLLDATAPSAYELVRSYWREALGAQDFEGTWRRLLHDGLVAESAVATKRVAPRKEAVVAAAAELAGGGAGDSLELALRPDPAVWDGAFANNGWLQELPKPLSKITWDNALLVAPATAQKLKLQSGQMAEVEADGSRLEVPVWIQPGQAPGTVTLHLGYGRTRAGKVGTGAGVNASLLRTSLAPWTAAGVSVRATAKTYPLATTQLHHNMEGRHLVRHGSVHQYLEEPSFVQEMGETPPRDLTLYPQHDYPGYSWGMAIDLSCCTGCSACVVACQAENNIPVVGKEQVLRGREMHWLRIDRYFQGDLDQPAVHHQPVPCMHCEQAPCEVVCPVAATVHSNEGLNDMVYNRCVGTRYCSNNCPYKVRRFNFFKYNDTDTEVLKFLRNPDVTVRTRGVMEKCTYCVQRINYARIEAKREGRSIRDGEVVTACQQACPSQAIAFGNLNDPEAEVSRWKGQPLNYGLLEELNTRPRTTYLAKLSNTNPELEGA